MMILWLYFISFFLVAAGIAFSLTPFVRKLTIQYQVMDVPDERKPHEHAIPTMGGIAMYVAFFAAILVANISYSFWMDEPLFQNFKIGHLFLGATPLVLAGMIDDRFHINYKWKLAVQIAVAISMIYSGYGIYGITNPFNGETVPLGFLSNVVTIFWFLFIINAINFMDGIDGLAAGVSLIALLTIFVVSIYLGHVPIAVLAIILAGAIIGFLRYNFYPASIFMGDTGSLFLGFLIAILSLHGAQKSSTAVALAIPIVILGLPILDAIGAVIRRWSSEWARSRTLPARVFSWRKVFYPDLGHIHHRLLAHGLTKPETVALLYLVAFGFGVMGFVLVAARYQQIAAILLYMGVVFFIAFRKFPVFRRLLTDVVTNTNPVELNQASDSELTEGKRESVEDPSEMVRK
ncbi:MAG: undecaprenyl/decaprenyl-phosphate alpha-N-acetylglucosaminyl 1-phosphate transferase [Candidatus Omnitrophica bacterium]|nr:undecaprenyl/decaprenyl-phosphate alpha-N-acetylglucosaminyl 1-phosphate transferase [Candidatus Omnitrophota bacterium]